MRSNLPPDCLDAFPEPLLVVMGSGRVDAVNAPAADLLGLARGDQPEVTLRELAGLSAAEFEELLHYCLSHSVPVPLRLSFFPAGSAALDMRCAGWLCSHSDWSAAMLRVSDDKDSSKRFGALMRLVIPRSAECMVRRHSQIRMRA